MAILHGKKLSGLLGNQVIRNYKKRVTVSAAIIPGTMKQTEATKLSANTFGLASRLAMQIRIHPFAILHKLYDSTLVNRLNTVLYRILLDSRNKTTHLFDFSPNAFLPLAGLEFNALSPVSQELDSIPVVELKAEKLTVHLADLRTPDRLVYSYLRWCKWTVAVIHYQLDLGKQEKKPQIQSIEVSAKTPEQPIEDMVFEAYNGCLCIVTFTMSYIANLPSGPFTVNTKDFSPACIVDALLIPGKFEERDGIFADKGPKIISQKDRLQ